MAGVVPGAEQDLGENSRKDCVGAAPTVPALCLGGFLSMIHTRTLGGRELSLCFQFIPSGAQGFLLAGSVDQRECRGLNLG